MERTHQLIKLKIETVQDLKRLMLDIGQGSFHDFIAKMIRNVFSVRKLYVGSKTN